MFTHARTRARKTIANAKTSSIKNIRTYVNIHNWGTRISASTYFAEIYVNEVKFDVTSINRLTDRSTTFSYITKASQ